MTFSTPTTTDPDDPRLRVLVPLKAPERDDDRDRWVPMDDDEKVPGETLAQLGLVRSALVTLVDGLFGAAEAIVAALLRLVQDIAGRDVAEAVDQGVADVVDPLVSRLPGADRTLPPGAPTGEAPTDRPEAPPDLDERDAADLRSGVREILLAHAGSDAERQAVSPALVEMVVTTGVQFLLSVERQFPGAIEAFESSGTLGVVDAPVEADAVASALPAEADDATSSTVDPVEAVVDEPEFG